MRVTTAALLALNDAFEARYQTAYQAAEPWWNRVATEVPSSTKGNTYGWMLKLPRLRQWVGERVLQNVAAASYNLPNEHFELTVSVNRNDIEDDNLGVYNPTIDMIGQQARLYPDDLLAKLMQEGESTLCWDGQSFFDPDHPVNINDPSMGTYSNLLSLPLTPANYKAARAAMRKFKGEDGKSLRVRPNLLVVPPDLEGVALDILEAETIDNSTNTMQGTAELLVIEDLADQPDDWYLLDVSRPIRPFVFQNRKAPQFAALTELTSENVFMRNEFVWGVDARGNAGYGLPFLALKSKG